MIRRAYSILKKNAPLNITTTAWGKMKDVLDKDNTRHAFMFSAQGGGCNGFNYNLETIKEDEYTNLMNNKVKPIMLDHIDNKNIKLIIEPMSEMLVMGTTIDFIKEDYSQNIFESKFTFMPQKDLATSCGCGISFALK
jgi:iron-sulfur cluster assembly accessory protein